MNDNIIETVNDLIKRGIPHSISVGIDDIITITTDSGDIQYYQNPPKRPRPLHEEIFDSFEKLYKQEDTTEKTINKLKEQLNASRWLSK